MKVVKLILKNSFRHKLRATLTILGIAVAIIAFGVLRTVVTAWYQAVDASSNERLITRQSVSFIFPLPLSYEQKIEQVPGVDKVTYANWFGGTYINKQNFFARLGVDVDTYFQVYPEYELTKEEFENFKKERNACVIGSITAKQYNLKVGDVMTLDGDIYPGKWDFVIRGIYKPKYKSTDETGMFFHWDYINERMKDEMPLRANDVGWYIEKIDNPQNSGKISKSIDNLFKNSPNSTKTETEVAFSQGFIASSSAIITSMNVMSFVIVGIILLVLANTMIMSSRERTTEYAVLKTLGFSAYHLFFLILGESLFIAVIGGLLGLLMTFPIVQGFSMQLPKGFFPVFEVEPITIILCAIAVVVIGFAAAYFPIHKALKTKIVDGLRFVG
jgi:putative ABC transport system permease protein